MSLETLYPRLADAPPPDLKTFLERKLARG